jgi:hypothetical protein
MRTRNKGAPFPPIANPCPDYWNVNSDGKCSATIKSATDNTFYNIGTLSMPLNTSDTAPYATNNIFDPKNVKWAASGKSAICAQRDWSLQNGIEWQGISNYNGC